MMFKVSKDVVMKKTASFVFVAVLMIAHALVIHCAQEEVDYVDASRRMITMTILEPIGTKKMAGIMTSDDLEKYALVRDCETKKISLCSKGDNLGSQFKVDEIHNDYLVTYPGEKGRKVIMTPGASFEGLEFVKTVDLDTCEYWYRIKSVSETVSERNHFELIELDGTKAMLETVYKEDVPLLTEEKIPSTKKSEQKEEPYLDEIFINQLRTRRISRYEWDVDSLSVSGDVLDGVSRSISTIAKMFIMVEFGKKGKGLRVRLKGKVGAGVLDKSGILVDSLSPAATEKTGLEQGDVITYVNGKRASSLVNLALIFFGARDSSVPRVEVKIIRDDKPVVLTYNVR